jgi:hypothetical protein
MADDEIKRIDIQEFRELGFLQEVNRRVLHPAGLALEIVVEEDGTEHLGGVWDYRDDPEGMVYGDIMAPEKAASVDALIEQHRAVREELFGWLIQPVDAPVSLPDPL